MSWTPNRIVLIGKGRYDEAKTSAVCYPGQIIKLAANGTMAAHATVGRVGRLLVVTENVLDRGGSIRTSIPSGLFAPYYIPAKGDKLLLLLRTGENVVAGQGLCSNGDGSLKSCPDGVELLSQILAASSNITNVTADTAFSNGTYSIPANFLAAGDRLRIRGKAVVSAQNSTNTHRVRMYLGSTAVADSGAVALAANEYAQFDATITVRSIGATGSLIASGVVGSNPAGVQGVQNINLAATAFDTTAAIAVTVKSTASAQSTGNVIALQEFSVELLRANGDDVVVYADEAIDNSLGGEEFGDAAFIRVAVP